MPVINIQKHIWWILMHGCIKGSTVTVEIDGKPYGGLSGYEGGSKWIATGGSLKIEIFDLYDGEVTVHVKKHGQMDYDYTVDRRLVRKGVFDIYVKQISVQAAVLDWTS